MEIHINIFRNIEKKNEINMIWIKKKGILCLDFLMRRIIVNSL